MDRKRSTADRPSPSPETPERPRWDATHKRYTVHLPVDLVEAIDAENRRTGRSKATIVSAALRAYFEPSTARPGTS